MKLLCLGDSLTEGYGLESKDCWTTLLEKNLNINVINAGVSGDTTTGMLARLPYLIEKHEPTHILIMGGTNDVWLKVPQQLIIANIHAIIRQARFSNIIPIIGVPPPAFTTEDYQSAIFVNDKDLPDLITTYQNFLKSYIREDEQLFVDFSMMTKDLFMEDGVHINKVGQIEMMHKVKKVIQKLS